MVTLILLSFALSLELATLGASGAVGVGGPRIVYRWTWWVPPMLVGICGIILAVTGAALFYRVIGAMGVVLAATSAILLPFNTAPSDAPRTPRRSLSGDVNRPRRVATLFLAAALVLAAAALDGGLSRPA